MTFYDVNYHLLETVEAKPSRVSTITRANITNVKHIKLQYKHKSFSTADYLYITFEKQTHAKTVTCVANTVHANTILVV